MPSPLSAALYAGLSTRTGASTSSPVSATGHTSCWVRSGVWQLRHSQRLSDFWISFWNWTSVQARACVVSSHSAAISA